MLDLLGSCLCKQTDSVLRVTTGIFVSDSSSWMSVLRKTAAAENTPSQLRSIIVRTVHTEFQSPSTHSRDQSDWFLVPLDYTSMSISRLALLLESIPPDCVSGQMWMVFHLPKAPVHMFTLFMCVLVQFIRDNYPTQPIMRLALDFLEQTPVHRSFIRLCEEVILLTSPRNRGMNQEYVSMLTNVSVTGLPSHRVPTSLQLISASARIGDPSHVRRCSPGGSSEVNLRLLPREEYCMRVNFGETRVLNFQVTGLGLLSSPLLLLTRGDLHPQVELLVPVPDDFQMALLSTPPTVPPVLTDKQERLAHLISALPTFKYQGGQAEDVSCEICMSTYTAGDDIRALPCMHWFHSKCVDEWLRVQPHCPNCRADSFALLHPPG